jgi:hypothetical protein
MKAQDSFTPRVLIATIRPMCWKHFDCLSSLRVIILKPSRPADIIKSIEERDFDVL